MSKLVHPSELIANPVLSDGETIPLLSEAEYTMLRASIETHGILQPILVAWPERVVIDGHHRLRAAIDLGFDRVPVMLDECHTADQQEELGIQLNAARRHWTREARELAIRKRLKRGAHRSNRDIATTLCVDDKTVAKYRLEMEATAEIPHFDFRTDKAGKQRKASGTPRPRVRSNIDDPITTLPPSETNVRDEGIQQNPAPQAVAVPRKPSEVAGGTPNELLGALSTESGAERKAPELPDGSTDEQAATATETDAGQDDKGSAGVGEPTGVVSAEHVESDMSPSAVREGEAVEEAASPSAPLIVPKIVRALFVGIGGYGPVGKLPSPTSADLLAIDDSEAEDMALLALWLRNAHTRRKNLLAAEMAGAA